MKIGVVSDIHSNIFALEAVLNDCVAKNVEHLFLLGDLIGYYYWPKKVWDALRLWQGRIDIIQGNHENLLARSFSDLSVCDFYKHKYGSGLECVRSQLSSHDINFLVNLPKSKEVKINNIKFLLCHGAPWGQDVYIYPDADKAILDKCLKIDVDVILVGHTHYPMYYGAEGKILANPGSVGQPRDYVVGASYLLVDTNEMKFDFQRVAYNTNEIVVAVGEIDPDNDYLARVLLRGENNE